MLEEESQVKEQEEEDVCLCVCARALCVLESKVPTYQNQMLIIPLN